MALLDKLTNVNHTNYPRWQVWGGLALVGVLSLGIFIRTGEPPPPAAASRAETPLPPQAARPQPTATPVQYEPLADATDDAALPLQSPPTPRASDPDPSPLFLVHTVRSGETLISIAANYELSTETLLATNALRDPSLQTGQVLIIPASEEVRIPVVHHAVRAEEDLITIAAQYGSSVKDILAANPGLDEADLPVGETVVIPMIFNQPKPQIQANNTTEGVTYIVQPGDVPLTIAAQFDLPVEVLLSANDIVDPTLLPIGQELYIPPSEDVSLGFPVILHELVEGDTLLGIASLYGSSVKDILAINPTLDPSLLEPGELVAVPIIFDQPRPTREPGQEPAGPPPAPIEVSEPYVDLEVQMLEGINTERQANGLPEYQADDQLIGVAVAHAQDMVTRDYFSHVTPEGLTIRDRVAEGGVGDALRVGENIQLNTQPRERTVTTALNWFLGSRPHRNNLLHPAHNRIGIGIVEGPPGWYTFVLVFAQR